MDWYFEKRRAPQAALGATRKQYGTTWWGQQWLQALTSIDFSNRLPRGRTYANKGLAHDLELDGNVITARVTGTAPRPYRVRVTVPPFDDAARQRLIEVVTANPLYLSKLLNRELPPELNAACVAANVHIFPQRWDDLQGSCSCPDHAVPCKHLAAVLYLVANEIDKNPFLVFDLHGFDLVGALEESGYAEAAAEKDGVPALARFQQPIAVDDSPPFVFDEAALAAVDFSEIPDCRENLLRLLGEKPVFYPEGDFKKLLATVYKNVAGGVESVLAAPREADGTPGVHAVESALLLLDAIDGSLLDATLGSADNDGDGGFRFDSAAALSDFLQDLPEVRLAHAAPELRGLHLAWQLSAVLARRGAFVPQIVGHADGYAVRFVPALLNDTVRALCDRVQVLVPPGLLVYVGDADEFEPTATDYLPALLALFLGHFVAAHGGGRRATATSRAGSLPARRSRLPPSSTANGRTVSTCGSAGFSSPKKTSCPYSRCTTRTTTGPAAASRSPSASTTRPSRCRRPCRSRRSFPIKNSPGCASVIAL